MINSPKDISAGRGRLYCNVKQHLPKGMKKTDKKVQGMVSDELKSIIFASR